MRAHPYPAMSCAVQSPSRNIMSHDSCAGQWARLTIMDSCAVLHDSDASALACVSAHGQFGPARRNCQALNVRAGAWQRQLITCQVMVPASMASRRNASKRQPKFRALRSRTSAGARSGLPPITLKLHTQHDLPASSAPRGSRDLACQRNAWW